MDAALDHRQARIIALKDLVRTRERLRDNHILQIEQRALDKRNEQRIHALPVERRNELETHIDELMMARLREELECWKDTAPLLRELVTLTTFPFEYGSGLETDGGLP
ncbi:hypothetical protein HY478_03470 [Candidatus Uhrbacteria bacterium]|nr:hypothetical protein [Candidatus Uhrbacteria bacterium]